MAAKQPAVKFKSFEQLRAELFPNLTDHEGVQESKKNAQEFGITLADRAIDWVLAHGERSKSAQ